MTNLPKPLNLEPLFLIRGTLSEDKGNASKRRFNCSCCPRHQQQWRKIALSTPFPGSPSRNKIASASIFITTTMMRPGLQRPEVLTLLSFAARLVHWVHVSGTMIFFTLLTPPAHFPTARVLLIRSRRGFKAASWRRLSAKIHCSRCWWCLVSWRQGRWPLWSKLSLTMVVLKLGSSSMFCLTWAEYKYETFCI